MQLDITTFKKAAKRLAANQDTSLSTAQETLAEAFGFVNLNAALKALGTPASNAQAALAPTGLMTTWRGLPLMVAVDRILAAAYDGPAGSTQQFEWQYKSRILLKAVLYDLASTRPGACLSTQDLETAVTLKSIETRYLELWKEAGPERVFPRPSQRLQMYLESGCPAYKVDKLLVKHGLVDPPAGRPGHPVPGGRAVEQDSMAFEQHAYRVNPIVHGLMELEDIDLTPLPVQAPAPEREGTHCEAPRD